MPKLMIITARMRPGRVGPAVAAWFRSDEAVDSAAQTLLQEELRELRRWAEALRSLR